MTLQKLAGHDQYPHQRPLMPYHSLSALRSGQQFDLQELLHNRKTLPGICWIKNTIPSTTMAATRPLSRQISVHISIISGNTAIGFGCSLWRCCSLHQRTRCGDYSLNSPRQNKHNLTSIGQAGKFHLQLPHNKQTGTAQNMEVGQHYAKRAKRKSGSLEKRLIELHHVWRSARPRRYHYCKEI